MSIHVLFVKLLFRKVVLSKYSGYCGEEAHIRVLGKPLILFLVFLNGKCYIKGHIYMYIYPKKSNLALLMVWFAHWKISIFSGTGIQHFWLFLIDLVSPEICAVLTLCNVQYIEVSWGCLGTQIGVHNHCQGDGRNNSYLP